MEQIRVLCRLVVTIMCFVCLGFSVGMCSESDAFFFETEESDALIKTYVSSSLPSDDLVDSPKLQLPSVSESDWSLLVLGSEVPVMVLFTSENCGQCYFLDNMVDQLDSEFTGRFKFYQVNVDEEHVIPARYGVQDLPTITIFKRGDLMVALSNEYFTPQRLRELVQLYV